MTKTAFSTSLMDGYQLARRSGFLNMAQAFSEMLLDEELGPELQKADLQDRRTQILGRKVAL